MKKIVFVSGRLGGGGSERVLTLIANELLKRGYDVSIITFGRYEEYRNNYENSCPVYAINFTNDFNQIAGIRKKIKGISPDVVIAFEYYIAMKTVIACFGLKLKVIVSERNDPHKLDSHVLKRILRNYLYKKSDCLVCQTNDSADYFNKLGVNNTKVIPNPVKDNLPKWDISHKEKIIINFCKLEKQKNLPMLIRSCKEIVAHHPDFALHIYGEGTEKENLERIIAEEGLKETVSIYPFSHNIHEIVSKCFMFVSSSDYEGLSNSMLEAMAIGIPVVCTDCPIGGANMLIKDGENGFLARTGNLYSLSSKIIFVIEHPELLGRISENSRDVIKHLSLKNITHMWEVLIQNDGN